MGGIPTNVEAEVLRNNTDVVPGLYAAGEVACVSVHGANRLGTNSLLDINVFGKRSGINAAEFANTNDFVEMPEGAAERVEAMLERLVDNEQGENIATIRLALQESMDMNAGVYRTEATLKQAQTDIAELRVRYQTASIMDKGLRYNTELLEAVELGFLLELAEVLVVSALARNESRGGHYREDYPTRDDANFMRHTMAYKNGDDITIDYKPVVITRYQPMERKY